MRTALLVCALLGACYSPSVAPCVYRCAADSACPDGLSCNTAGMCSENATACTDLGTDGRGSDDPDPNDHTAPTVTFDSPGTIGPLVDIKWMVDEPSTPTCMVDNTNTACTGTEWIHNVPEGPHTFTVAATDFSQNTSGGETRNFSVVCEGPHQLPTGAFGLLKFEEGNGQTYKNTVEPNVDAFAGSNMITQDGAEPMFGAGRFNGGLHFSGGAATYVTWPVGRGMLGAFTIDFWLHPNTINLTNDQTVISDDTDDLLITIPRSTRKIAFSLRGPVGNGSIIITSMPLLASDWNFVTATYDGSKMRLYVNGAFAGSQDLARTDINFATLYAGAHSGTALDADFDEFMFATAQSTAAQVAGRYCPRVFAP